jgi:hypothetical protein
LFGVCHQKNIEPSAGVGKSVYNKRAEIFDCHKSAAIADRTKWKRNATPHGLN